MNIGIDLGRTIVDNTTRKPFEGAFEVIKQIIASGHDTFIVSRVNSEQRDRANKWLGETSFYPLTGFNQNNLYFCWERRDKAIFARYLHLDLFIDDRVDCLIPMDENVRKILFNPDEKNADQCAKSEANIVVASNWDEVKSYLWLANLSPNMSNKYRIEERQYRDETEFVVQEFHKGRNQYEDRSYWDNLKEAKELVAAYKERDDRDTVRKTIIHE